MRCTFLLLFSFYSIFINIGCIKTPTLIDNLNKFLFPTLRMNNRFERNTEVSCAQSPIETNVTLKGGIEAGYFRKLAQHVAMQLCIELCCEEKGCDVAFMSGKNCYGVQCFNEELCRALPAKKDVSEPVMISQVTFKGEQMMKKFSTKLQCKKLKVETDKTLRGGLDAGKFTDVGRADNIESCIKVCCMSDRCDVALLINQECFTVACLSPWQCEPVPSVSMEYKPTIAFVARRHHNSKGIANSLQVLETTDNQLVCKNSQIFHNTTLKGGYKAGNYTNFGKVSNMSACVRLCCGNRDCDAALMLENNCFAVACSNSDNCLPVHAKTSTSLAALNPRISYITSRSEQVSLKQQLTPDGTCQAGIISYDVSLKGGSNAGNFTPHGKIGSMEACIYKCCEIEGCSVAMMLKDACFTIVCATDGQCEKKQTPTSSDFNPRIAYVFRGKNKTQTTKKKMDLISSATMKNKKKQLLAERLHALSKMPAPTMFSSTTFMLSTLTINRQLKPTPSWKPPTQRLSSKLRLTTGNANQSNPNNVSRDQFHNETASMVYNFSNFRENKTSISKLKSTLLAVDGDPSCTSSEVLYNVTLRNGLHSGKFRDRGQMEHINQCVKLCCLLEKCDLAFMLQNTCFSVECSNRFSCDAVPAKSSIYSPTVCYVYVKSAPEVR